MEIDDLKKVWTKVNRDSGQPVYSVEDIADFRKARSKDFSTWIQNGLILDVVLKGIFITAYFILIYLLRESTAFMLTAFGIVIIGIMLIVFELRYLKNSKQLDRKDISVQGGIKTKLTFLKSYYYRIQFLQGLTNPMFVAAGVFFYYFVTYGEIRIEDLEDVVIIVLLLVISFLFTLPTTLSLYGYHYRVLKTALASLEDEESWAGAIKRYNKQKKILYLVFGSMLIIGLAVLAWLILS